MIDLAGAALTIVSTIGLVAAEHSESRMRTVWKPLASVGFLIVALNSGLPDAHYGWLILAGLVCSLIGDVALLGTTKGAFLGGLGAFLLAHVLYAVAFWTLGQASNWSLPALAVLIVASVAIGRWLLPHVEGDLRIPVLIYMAAITVMVVLAFGAVGAGSTGLIAVGAGLFYLSDLAVARQQFVASGFINRAWGLPTYYAAQLILASTI